MSRKAPNRYAERADLWPLDPKGELVLWVMIESEPAVENIHAIAAVPSIGGLSGSVQDAVKKGRSFKAAR